MCSPGPWPPWTGWGPTSCAWASWCAGCAKAGVREVIIATNPTVEGEATADLVARALAGCGAMVTRLGYGMPVGGDLKYMDGLTLSRSLEARRKLR